MPLLTMPKMGDAMEEGTILRWLKKEGEKVEEGEIVAEIETGKATAEAPALEAGTLTRILVQEGETVPVGAPIAELNGTGAAAAQAQPSQEQSKPVEAPPEKQERAQPPAGGDREATPGGDAPAPARPSSDLAINAPPTGLISGSPEDAQRSAGASAEGRIKATPLARKIAAASGLDLGAVQGTGPGGRILEADVEDALRRGPSAPLTREPSSLTREPAPRPRETAPFTPSTRTVAPTAQPAPGSRRKFSQIRKVIARRLQESKQQIPHFYLTNEVDMRAAVAVRQQYNASADEDRKISINDLVIRACALALEKHPALHSRIEGDEIVTPSTVNIGVAVSLDEGLIVPVVRDAQTKSLSVLGREVRSLADRARKGQLKPEEYSGGGFSLSNLGMYDIAQFQAIINPPEVAILAVGVVRDAPIVDGGQIVPGKQMYLTISVDHRVVDGSVAAEFMQELKRLLQNPLVLFG